MRADELSSPFKNVCFMWGKATLPIGSKGKPVVKVVAVDASVGKKKRIGFMNNAVAIPDDFNEMGREQIAALYTSTTK